MWLVDSGCSRHMTGSSKWFTSLNKASGDEFITFGDNSRGRVTHKGAVRVNNNNILKDVALVSKLRYNLISVSQLIDDDYEVCFKKNGCRVLDSSGALAFGISRPGRVFAAEFGSSESRCFLATSSSVFQLWHQIGRAHV